MSVEQNIAAVEAFIAAMNAGDVPAIVDAYAPDGSVTTMGNTLISGTFDKAAITMAAATVAVHSVSAAGNSVFEIK